MSERDGRAGHDDKGDVDRKRPAGTARLACAQVACAQVVWQKVLKTGEAQADE